MCKALRFDGLRTQQLVVDPYFHYFSHFIKPDVMFAPINYNMHKTSINKVINNTLKHNHDKHNHHYNHPLNHQQYTKAYYKMTATSKWPLISESVTVIRIGVHLAGEEPDQHVVCMAPRVSHMTIVRKVPTKSKLGPCFWDEVLAPSDRLTRPSS
jgi:hypothetical protein